MSKTQSNNTYCIYKHTSIESGKCYIGQTNHYTKRCREHKRTERCIAFSSAIKKYGWNNFDHEILEENLSVEEANTKEVYYIEFYNSLAPNGYNLKVGGENKRFSEETKRKIIISNTGRFVSSETREKMSKARKGMKYTKVKVKVKKEKISKSKKGIKKRKTWHILDKEGNEIIIENLKQFCIDNNLNYDSIASGFYVRGKYKEYKFLGFIEKA